MYNFVFGLFLLFLFASVSAVNDSVGVILEDESNVTKMGVLGISDDSFGVSLEENITTEEEVLIKNETVLVVEEFNNKSNGSEMGLVSFLGGGHN